MGAAKGIGMRIDIRKGGKIWGQQLWEELVLKRNRGVWKKPFHNIGKSNILEFKPHHT